MRRLALEVTFILAAAALTARILWWQSERLAEQVERHCVYSLFAEGRR